MKAIKLFNHYVHQEAIDNVERVLRSGWTGLGQEVKDFEDEFARYLGVPYVIAFNSGTAALEAAIACSWGELEGSGCYIITTPNTFVSTNHVIYKQGYLPAFADIDLTTGNINLDSVARLVSKLRGRGDEVTGIMVVHYGGCPVGLAELYEYAHSEKLLVIEDCAHACGSVYGADKIGAYPHTELAAFSFHSVKNLAIGDGGALVVNTEEKYKFCKEFRWLGINKSTSERQVREGEYSWKYDVDMFGEKSHMNNISAAIGRGQLIHLDKDNEYRKTLYDKYFERLEPYVTIVGEDIAPYSTSSHHLMSILLKNVEARDAAIRRLKDNGIETGVHYYPNHLYSTYDTEVTDNRCPKATKFADIELSLPMHLGVSLGDVDLICNILLEQYS